MSKNFNVLSQLRHNGEVFEAGDKIAAVALNEEQIKLLIDAGTIEATGKKTETDEAPEPKKVTKPRKTKTAPKAVPANFKLKKVEYTTEDVHGQLWYRRNGKRIAKDKWLAAQKKASK